MIMDDVNAADNSSIQADMSVNSSLHPPVHDCFKSRTTIFILTGLLSTYVLLLLPVFILVLFVGLQRWRKQRSVSMAATMSHSDFFTYNMVALELISIFGSFSFNFGIYMDLSIVTIVGSLIDYIISPGQTMFHLLTCVERYLAVVHPITYLGLRQARAIRIRNISTGCVWLLCIASVGLTFVPIINFYVISHILFLVVCIILVFFCSLSVLCVLIRSGPGEVGGNRERVDQSKQRAFQTIMAIMAVLLLRLVATVVGTAMYSSSVFNNSYSCVVTSCSYWFNLPSSLVLPLLFLHRAGKLPGCKHNTVG